jgi:hypothetical protein
VAESERPSAPPQTGDEAARIQSQASQNRRSTRLGNWLARFRPRNWLIDTLASSAVVLFVGFIFEHLLGPEVVEELDSLQKGFESALSAFSPNQVLWYVEDSVSFFSRIFGAPPNSLIIIVFYLLLALAALPVVILAGIFASGHVFAGITYIAAWLFVLPLIIGSIKDRGVFSEEALFAPIFAIVFMLLFLWLVYLVVMIGDVLFGQLVAMAGACLGGSVIGSIVYHCTVKVGEHSVTERALHALKHFGYGQST